MAIVGCDYINILVAGCDGGCVRHTRRCHCCTCGSIFGCSKYCIDCSGESAVCYMAFYGGSAWAFMVALDL